MSFSSKNTVNTFKNWQVLAPGGGFSSPQDILNASRLLRQFLKSNSQNRGSAITTLEKQLEQHLKVPKIYCFGSGKESLFRLLKAVRLKTSRQYVVMSAYTCPDLPISAIRAGLKVFLLDVNENTLLPRLDSLPLDLEHDVAAVILSNLWGVPDELSPWLRLANKAGFLVIDDGSQAVLSRVGDNFCGAREGTWGILSFGRGKAICGIGGGGLVCADGSEFAKTLLAVLNEGSTAEEVHVSSEFLDTLKWFLYWLFERPWLYAIPARMPFLGLGETNCEFNFSLKKMSVIAVKNALAQIYREDVSIKNMLRRAMKWHSLLGQSHVVEPIFERNLQLGEGVLPIRYPILLESAKLREVTWKKLYSAGLGASCAYPKVLSDYKELEEHVEYGELHAAKRVSTHILTLPVHSYITDKMQEQAVKIILD